MLDVTPTSGRPDMTDQATEPPRLPLVEVAAKMGKSTEAVRSLVRRGRLKAVRSNTGALLVELPTDPERSDDRAAPDALLEADHWREAAHRAEVAQARAEAERDAAKETGEARAAALHMLVDELRAELTHLRAELADARRPWWRRWIGS
jgi:hypothetical protein